MAVSTSFNPPKLRSERGGRFHRQAFSAYSMSPSSREPRSPIKANVHPMSGIRMMIGGDLRQLTMTLINLNHMISKITITTSGNFDFLMSICGNWNLRRLRRSSSVRHRWLQFPAMRDRHRKEGSYSYWLSTHVGSISHVLCFQIPDYQVWFGYSAYLLTFSIQLIWWWIFFHNIQYSSLLPWYSHDNPMICCENIQKYSHHFPYIPIISYKFP